MSKKSKYISDWIQDYLQGKTPEEVGMDEADLRALIFYYENGVDPKKTHFKSVNWCACNICRS